MNTSERRINKEIQDILLRAKNNEPAFDGTVKEGFERRYTVINERDLKKYCSSVLIEELDYEISLVTQEIELGREMEGKKPYNNYIVINLDEPYVDEVIEIMKRNGHWEGKIPHNDIDIEKWIKKCIEGPGGLLDYEEHELAVRNDTDEIVSASWILRCLANPKNEGSDKVLQAILDYRAAAKKS